MVELKSDDWLPAGWTVEVAVRKNGKKDKRYITPSGELKFHSKVEVSRYLNGEKIKHAESERKKNGRRKLSASNAVVEEATVEGLPPGWIKEIKVRKKACAIKRDPYYTDPVSGYVFRSMKDVLRYLNTGDLGRLAFKPKDGGGIDMKPDKLTLLPIAKEQNSADSGNGIDVVTEQCLKSNGIIQDMHILESVRVGECKLLQHSSDKCVEGTDLNSLNMSEVRDSEQLQGEVDFSEGNSALALAVEAIPEKKPSEHTNHLVVRRGKSKGGKEPNFPRRSSKRLARVELEPTPELKSNTRTRKSTRSAGEAETNPAEGFCLGSQELDQLQSEQEANYTINTSKSTEELLQANNHKILSGDFTNSEKNAGEAKKDSKIAENQASSHDASLGNQPPFVQHVEMAETENNTYANPGGSPLVLPFGDSWPDPCIEFAVKTLTGEIDLDILDYFHQINSSQGETSLQLPNFGLDNFCQTDQPTLSCSEQKNLRNSGDKFGEAKR